jgi:hypothetical protein
MKTDGHCHCGQIAFEGEVDPTALTICHCTDCQTLTGSAFHIASHSDDSAKCYPLKVEVHRPRESALAGWQSLPPNNYSRSHGVGEGATPTNQREFELNESSVKNREAVEGTGKTRRVK